jgi:hypothetical protein
MKTATTFDSEFTNSQGLLIDGVPHLSITGATKLMYGNAGGASIERLRTSLTKMSGPKSPVAATDLSLLDGICPVQTTSGKGRAQTALAMTQELFVEMLWHFAEKNTAGGKRAKVMLKSLAGVSLDLILKKEAGLVTEEAAKEIDASIAKFFKSEPGKEKAGSIQGLKELLIANGQKDRCARMGVLVNEFIYNRLPKPVYEELLARTGARRGHLDHTKWQHLDESTQKRIDDIISVASMLIRREMREGQILNFAPVIKDLDEVMPRHRSSGYVSL